VTRGNKKIEGGGAAGAAGRGKPRRQASSAPAINKEPVRLQKYLADAGVTSRRKAEEMIAAGRVRVNGEVVSVPGTKVTPGHDKVTVDSHQIKARKAGHYVYYALNKPRGFLVTSDDPEGRKTIYELITGIRERVIPVGRLDRDSEGLLILTNDGELANRLMHPRYKVAKEYEVRIAGRATDAQVRRLREGVEIDGGKTQPALVEVAEVDERGMRLYVTITEGKKRQVRQMLEAIGHEVKRLMRVREGCISLRDMGPGKWRELTPQEVTDLRKEVKLI